MIEEYFSTLEDWKLLPAYKLETRIDSLVGFSIPRVFESIYGTETDILIPELPIRLGTIKPEPENERYANQSYKVDFYLRSKDMKNFFIEFKSDSRSRRDAQDDYLSLSKQIGMRGILSGILKIYEVTTYRKKYSHLLEKLRSVRLLNEANEILIDDEPIEIVYIQPKELATDEKKRILGFKELALAIRDCYPDSDFMIRLSASLIKWASD